MIESIIEWSIRNRYLVILASLALAVAGVRAMQTMPVDAVPDLSENQVIVFADWMGRSPQEIEDQVTYPLSSNPRGWPARPFRGPGSRPRPLDGAAAPRGRRPGCGPPRLEAPGAGRREGGAVVERVQLLDDHHHLRRRDRLLLRPRAGPGAARGDR